jgi:thiamine-phosphate diphosphorylase
VRPLRSLPVVYAVMDLAAAAAPDHASIVRRLLSVGVSWIQVREKSRPDRELLADLRDCASLGGQAGASILVNDRPDLAAIAGVGVHLGVDDLPAAEARALLGEDALVGVSTHTVEEAGAAFSEGAPDYIAFGPVFSSPTKPARRKTGLETLARIAEKKTRPLVAIGGITAANLASVLDAGADSAAMVSALLQGGRIEENARLVLDAARRRTIAGRIYLVGFMGSGKTAVGSRLAERLGIPFVDLDAEIERTSGLTVRALFETAGEPVFRERESMFLQATESLPRAVVATGGGCYVAEENRRRIAALGVAVYLDPPLPRLLERLSRKQDRPLFSSREQAARLWAEREPFYRMGSLHVPLDAESIEKATDRVLIALDARRNTGFVVRSETP